MVINEATARTLTPDSIRPQKKPIGATSSVPYSSVPGFGDSSGGLSGSPSDKPTKYNSPLPIINTTSVPIETTTKDPYHLPTELKRYKPINMLMEYSIRYP